MGLAAYICEFIHVDRLCEYLTCSWLADSHGTSVVHRVGQCLGIAAGIGRRLSLGAIHKFFDLESAAAHVLLFHLPIVVTQSERTVC